MTLISPTIDLKLFGRERSLFANWVKYGQLSYPIHAVEIADQETFVWLIPFNSSMMFIYGHGLCYINLKNMYNCII